MCKEKLNSEISQFKLLLNSLAQVTNTCIQCFLLKQLLQRLVDFHAKDNIYTHQCILHQLFGLLEGKLTFNFFSQTITSFQFRIMSRQFNYIIEEKKLSVLKIAKKWNYTSIIKCHALKQIKIILQKVWLFQMKLNIFCGKYVQHCRLIQYSITCHK